MDDLLVLLLRRGAHQRPVRITTAEIGAEAGMSQQNASRRLKELEGEGYIRRGKDGLMLSGKARDDLSALYSSLRSAFEGGQLDMNGTIVSGLGEGKFYLSLEGYRRQITQKLGFEAFPGTLNIRLDEADLLQRQELRRMEPVVISGFRDGQRTYGDLFAYRCKVGGIECAIIIPLRTHHGQDIIELISASELKKTLMKKDGDRIEVVV